MPETVAEQIQKAAQALLSAVTSGQDIAGTVNSRLNQFLVWPYRASSASITDADDVTTKVFGNIIHTASQQVTAQAEPLNVKAETVACIIHSVHTLTRETLQEAYDNIRTIKKLKKFPIQNHAPGQIDTPLGIVFAIDAIEPMETLAEQMMLLNKS